MKIGLIGRSEQRGLGIQTMDYARHMRPERVLHVIIDHQWRSCPGAFGSMGLDEFPTNFDGQALDEDVVRAFLSGLDVVFSAETLYDWRLAEWAREAGVTTIVHGNPEFYRHGTELRGAPEPDAWWWPTDWRLRDLPKGPVIPLPVADDWMGSAAPPDADVLEVVHIAGHRAAGDRNGTDLFLASLRFVTRPVRVRIYGQDGHTFQIKAAASVTEVEQYPLGVEVNRTMYEGAHAVVLPRRYGGNCLPAYEAMASGCALVMTDCSPNRSWPILPVSAQPGPSQRTPAGAIRTWQAKPKDIAKAIDRLASDRDFLARKQQESATWAEAHRWSVLRPVYEAQTRLSCRG